MFKVYLKVFIKQIIYFDPHYKRTQLDKKSLDIKTECMQSFILEI